MPPTDPSKVHKIPLIFKFSSPTRGQHAVGHEAASVIQTAFPAIWSGNTPVSGSGCCQGTPYQAGRKYASWLLQHPHKWLPLASQTPGNKTAAGSVIWISSKLNLIGRCYQNRSFPGLLTCSTVSVQNSAASFDPCASKSAANMPSSFTSTTCSRDKGDEESNPAVET